ncbi:Cytochrome P450 [Sesbania bispinosa]|nr:Cytochrome P450 [Sesbania bispinosa]
MASYWSPSPFRGDDQLLYRTLGAMADKYGPAFNIWLGTRRAFVVSSWEVAKNASQLMTRHLPHVPKQLQQSIWDTTMPLEMLKHVRVSELNMGIRDLYNSWVQNGSKPVMVELNRWLDDLTLNMVVRMVCRKRYFDALPFLGWFDFQGHERTMKKTAKELDAILEGWLQEHRKQRVDGEVKAEGEQDFIDVMLSLEEEGHLSISSVTRIQASNPHACDTAAGTLTWAISLLLNNRLTLKKAQEELDMNIGMERQVEESDIRNLSGPLLGPREAQEDCNVAGYHVPAGTRLVVNLWKIQRDPRIWEDPSVFRPERFLTSHHEVDIRGQNFELFPFGSGRRSCPGMSFALLVLHLTLAHLLHAFEFATPSNEPVDMTESPGLTIPKATPLKALLTPRLPTQLYA